MQRRIRDSIEQPQVPVMFLHCAGLIFFFYNQTSRNQIGQMQSHGKRNMKGSPMI